MSHEPQIVPVFFPCSVMENVWDKAILNFLPWSRHWWRHECMRHNLGNYTSYLVTWIIFLCGGNLNRPDKHHDKQIVYITVQPWWRHQMETFSALMAICAGNSLVSGEFPTQRPVTRSFDVFFDLRLNKRLSKQSWGWWFGTPSSPLWRHSNGKNI